MTPKVRNALLGLWVASPLLIFGLALRNKYFPSERPEDWAHAGDWLSGASTLTIGIIGTYLIYMTIKQNSKALEDSSKIIEHSQQLQSLVAQQLAQMAELQSKVAEGFETAAASLNGAIQRMESVAIGIRSQLDAAEIAVRVKQLSDSVQNLDATIDALLDREIPIHSKFGGALHQVKSAKVARLLEIQWDKQTSEGFRSEIERQHPETYSGIVEALRARRRSVEELRVLASSLAESLAARRATEEEIFL